METWNEINERHRRERLNLIAQFSKQTTQTEAAKKLDMSLQALNNFVHRNNIHWSIIKQGIRNEKNLITDKNRSLNILNNKKQNGLRKGIKMTMIKTLGIIMN